MYTHMHSGHMYPPLSGVPEVDSAFCEALKQAGSSSLEEFVINFNVDIMAPLARHADDPVSPDM